MTSRTTCFVMNGQGKDVLEDNLAFLKEMVDIFEHLSINSNRRTWKAIQPGLIPTTATALHMQEVFLQQKYLLLSRFAQDALENLFSIGREKNPVSRSKGFKMALRLVTLSQFFRSSRSGRYMM